MIFFKFISFKYYKMVKHFPIVNCKKDYMSNIELKLILKKLFNNTDIIEYLYNLMILVLHDNQKIHYYNRYNFREHRLYKLKNWNLKADIKHISAKNFIQFIDNKKNIKKSPSLKLKLKLINNSAVYKRQLVFHNYIKYGEAHINLYESNNGNLYNLYK